MVLQNPVANREVPVEIKVQNRVLKFEAVSSNPGQQSGQGKQLQDPHPQKSA
jgi:hypothetical protein